MGFFSKLFSRPAPARPIPKASGQPTITASAPTPFSAGYFEALRDSKDRTPITFSALQLSPTMPLLNFSRNQLLALGRYLYDNYGAVSYAVDTIANYSTPVRPQAASADAVWNEAANQYFADWTASADFSGRFDFYDLQRIACKAIDTDGDTGFSATNENGIVQLQMWEGWQIGPLVMGVSLGVIDGVRVDAKGRPVSYLIGLSLEKSTEIPANNFKLLYDPERYLAFRGFTPMRRGSNDVRDAQDIKGFEKLATKIGSALAGVLEVPAGGVPEDEWGEDESSPNGTAKGNRPPANDLSVTPHKKNLSFAELLGGDIPVLPDGQKFNQLRNERPGSNAIDFIDTLAGWFVLGLGLPPVFILDTKLTGPNLRAVIGKAQRTFERRKATLGRLTHWTWLRVIGDAIANDRLPSVPGWERIVLQGPPLATIDLGDQMANEREDVASALMSRRNHYGNRSLDWQTETDQIDAEQDYIFSKAQRRAKQYGIPIETVLAAYGFIPQRGNPQPQAQPTK